MFLIASVITFAFPGKTGFYTAGTMLYMDGKATRIARSILSSRPHNLFTTTRVVIGGIKWKDQNINLWWE